MFYVEVKPQKPEKYLFTVTVEIVGVLVFISRIRKGWDGSRGKNISVLKIVQWNL